MRNSFQKFGFSAVNGTLQKRVDCLNSAIAVI